MLILYYLLLHCYLSFCTPEASDYSCIVLGWYIIDTVVVSCIQHECPTYVLTRRVVFRNNAKSYLSQNEQNVEHFHVQQLDVVIT